MFYYPFSVTAAAPGNFTAFDARGGFVRYDEETTGSASPKLRFTSNKGHDFILKPGQSAKLSTPFERLQVQNFNGATALAGTIAIGDGDEIIFDSNVVGSVTAAIVQTAAGSARNDDSPVSSDNTFEAANFAGPVAAQLSFVGVSNAAGSGKRVYVDAFTWQQGGAVPFTLWTAFDAAGLGAGQPFLNKRAGGANATATFRTGTQAATIGGTGTPRFSIHGIVVAGDSKRIEFRRPYIVEPNNGFYIQLQTVNTQMTGALEIREY